MARFKVRTNRLAETMNNADIAINGTYDIGAMYGITVIPIKFNEVILGNKTMNPLVMGAIVSADLYCTADLVTRYLTGKGLSERVYGMYKRAYDLGQSVGSSFARKHINNPKISVA